MLFALFALGMLCLIFGLVYPCIMAVVWLLFYKDKEPFIDFMKEC